MLAATVPAGRQAGLRWVVEAWAWLGQNDAQVQALAGVAILLITLMIWLVYRKQAGIMRRQTEIMESQARIAARQASLQELIVTVDHSPQVVPADSAETPCHQSASFTIKNLGSGPAFDLSVFTWFVRPGSGTKRPANAFRPAKQYLLPGEPTRLAPVAHAPAWIQPERGEELAVVFHYSDVFGKQWHTTWHIHPGAHPGEERRDAPTVWNPSNWGKYAAVLEQYCEHCIGSGDQHGPADM